MSELSLHDLPLAEHRNTFGRVLESAQDVTLPDSDRLYVITELVCGAGGGTIKGVNLRGEGFEKTAEDGRTIYHTPISATRLVITNVREYGGFYIARSRRRV